MSLLRVSAVHNNDSIIVSRKPHEEREKRGYREAGEGREDRDRREKGKGRVREQGESRGWRREEV